MHVWASASASLTSMVGILLMSQLHTHSDAHMNVWRACILLFNWRRVSSVNTTEIQLPYGAHNEKENDCYCYSRFRLFVFVFSYTLHGLITPRSTRTKTVPVDGIPICNMQPFHALPDSLLLELKEKSTNEKDARDIHTMRSAHFNLANDAHKTQRTECSSSC